MNMPISKPFCLIPAGLWPALMSPSVIIILLTLTCAAETPLDPIRQRYDKERQDMLAALNKRYIQTLQSERMRVMAKQDLQGANDISAWISQLETEAAGPVHTPAPRKDPRDWFIGTTWSTSSAAFSFNADGTGTKLYKGVAGVTKWTLLEDNTVEMASGSVKEYFFFQSANRAEFAMAKNAPHSALTRKR